MLVSRLRVGVGSGVLAVFCACAPSREAVCPKTTGSEPARAAASPTSALAPDQVRAGAVGTSVAARSATGDANDGVSGTWLFSCCDGVDTYIGMLVLVETGGALRGSMLTDGDSHGSYVEGLSDGDHVRFSRRWYTAGVLHEQFYELVHDARAHRLVGTFTEPAYEAKPHEIRIERGFTPVPRRGAAPNPPEPTPPNDRQISKGASAEDAKRAWERKNRERPCDCKLVCYCGGVPPGPERVQESMRCGDECRCPLCPPLP